MEDISRTNKNNKIFGSSKIFFERSVGYSPS